MVFDTRNLMLFDHQLAWSDEKIYEEIYKNSLKDLNAFWLHHATDIDWQCAPQSAFDNRRKNWLDGGISNICYNCVDRHVVKTPHKNAIVWYGDEPGERRILTYFELHRIAIKIAAILVQNGVSKGDVVGIYMPMIPEAIAAMLACARIGAIHLVIFAGFAPEAMAYRLESSNAKLVLTVSFMKRGGRRFNLLEKVQTAISKMTYVPNICVLDDIDSFETQIDDKIEWVNNEDNLFILYTSGSSGKPKGIVHSTLSYMLYVATTFKIIFGANSNDVYFCTSDIGWITGHSYISYAPLFHGLTVVIFGGSPTYPIADRYWDIVEKEKVTIFYSSPTAIRSLQMFGESFVTKFNLSSLKVLGSVGEPIGTSAWNWYFDVIGKKKCPIIDTWWQTESGGIVLAPLRNLNQKPSTTGKPFFGVSIGLINRKDNKPINSAQLQGELVVQNQWPGRCRMMTFECAYSKHAGNSKMFCKNIFAKEYFNEQEMFMTGDWAVYDKDFDIRVIGRLDDVINVSGHRLSTAEFEDAINKVDGIKECAVVAVAHEIKGQTAFVYAVTDLPDGVESIAKKIIESTRKSIGPIAKPDFVAIVTELPKTRSGKIMRHLLRDIAQNKDCDQSDISSIINPIAVDIAKQAVQKALVCPDLCVLNKT